jgi:hypothetical protein
VAIAVLRFSNASGRVATVSVRRSTALGESNFDVSAAALGLSGTQGTAAIPIPTAALPFGTATFRVRFVDDAARMSDEVVFSVEVAGLASGGSAPSISGLTVEPATARRPPDARSTLVHAMRFSFADPDGDVAAVRVRVERPDATTTTRELTAAALGIRGVSGSVDKPALELRASDPPGLYVVTLTLFDQNGNASASATAQLRIEASAPHAAPSIPSFTPATGGAGTEVTLAGSDFEPSVFGNGVTLGGVPAEVVSASTAALTLRVPAGASSGPIVVTTSRGRAASADTFTVPPAVTLTSSAVSIEVGGTATLTATVVSAPTRAVEWLVDRTLGGHAAVGTISARGEYTAPRTVPARGAVTISARVVGTPAIVGTLELPILPPQPTPEGTLILAAVGGEATSPDGDAAILVPAGALGTDAVISVAPLASSGLPSPAGWAVAGGITLGPDGLVFQRPATVRVPLRRFMRPGRTLFLQQYFPASQTHASESVVARVDETGTSATAQVSHFSDYVLLQPVGQADRVPGPTVTEMWPTRGKEGTRVPVRIRGTGLIPELEVHVLQNGLPTPHIRPGPLYATGSEAGVLLDIGVLPAGTPDALGAGQTREYTLELRRPNTSMGTRMTFTVDGLDEWVVPEGTEVTNPSGGEYSSVTIAGTVRVTSGALAIRATSDVRIGATGRILATGTDGEDARPHGLGGRATGVAGAGGDHLAAGANAALCWSPTEPGCEAGHPRFQTFGVGGLPGENPDVLEAIVDVLSFIADLLRLAFDAIACVGSGGLVCAQLVVDVARTIDDFVDVVADFENLSQGARFGRGGAGGARNGDGTVLGGGGGGGGSASFQDDVLTALAGMPVYAGAGGGAGGNPGHAVRIHSGRNIYIEGKVTTRGGRGGHGGDGKYPGGGGGGGAAGPLELVASRRLVRARTAILDGRGGAGGRSGAVHDDDTDRDVRFEASAGGDGAGRERLNDSTHADSTLVFDSGLVDTAVTNRSVFLDVRLRGNALTRGTVRVTVRGENGDVRTIEASRTADFDFTFHLLLFPGFNTISALARERSAAAAARQDDPGHRRRRGWRRPHRRGRSDVRHRPQRLGHRRRRCVGWRRDRDGQSAQPLRGLRYAARRPRLPAQSADPPIPPTRDAAPQIPLVGWTLLPYGGRCWTRVPRPSRRGR